MLHQNSPNASSVCMTDTMQGTACTVKVAVHPDGSDSNREAAAQLTMLGSLLQQGGAKISPERPQGRHSRLVLLCACCCSSCRLFCWP